jgi:hypothetical protein
MAAQQFKRTSQYVIQTSALGGHNVRSAPSINGERITTLDSGSVVDAKSFHHDLTTNNIWVQIVTASGDSAWVLAQAGEQKYLTPVGESSPSSHPTEQQQPDTPPDVQARLDVSRHLSRFEKNKSTLTPSEVASILVDIMLLKDEHPEQAQGIHRDHRIRILMDHCSSCCDAMEPPVLSNLLWALDQLHTLDRTLAKLSHSGPTSANLARSLASSPFIDDNKCNPLVFLGSISNCLHSAGTALFSIPTHRDYCQVQVWCLPGAAGSFIAYRLLNLCSDSYRALASCTSHWLMMLLPI